MNDHTDITLNYPDTYFTLLPKDIRLLLSSFYFGSIEIKINGFRTRGDMSLVKLHIRVFRCDNKVNNIINIDIDIDELLQSFIDMYKHNNQELSLSIGNLDVTKEPNNLTIGIIRHGYMKSSGDILIIFYDREMDLFFQKLTMINNEINRYRKLMSDISQLSNVLENLTF